MACEKAEACPPDANSWLGNIMKIIK